MTCASIVVYFPSRKCAKMTRILSFIVFCLASAGSLAQGIELVDRLETYHAGLGQHARIPIRFRNTGDRPQVYVVRKAAAELNSNQKGYFCLGDDCFDPLVDQITRKLEPGEISTNLYFVVETGLSLTTNTFQFEIFPKGNQQLGIEHAVSLSVEDKPSRVFVFRSKEITVHDVYPNPVTDQQAFIDYRLVDEDIKAKVVIHNILGSPVGQYEMPSFETRVKIQAEELSSGVYFYTVYLDNIGVVTRKLVVRK